MLMSLQWCDKEWKKRKGYVVDDHEGCGHLGNREYSDELERNRKSV